MKKFLAILSLVSVTAFAHGSDHGRGRGHGRDGCDPRLRHRSAEEVLASHFANLANGDFDAERCNYARDAVVISDQGVFHGVDEIVLQLQGLVAFFGGQVPQVNEEVIVSILDNRTEMARILFSITVPCISINDGTDTYIIRDGKIVAQTAHGAPTFTCAPPM